MEYEKLYILDYGKDFFYFYFNALLLILIGKVGISTKVCFLFASGDILLIFVYGSGIINFLLHDANLYLYYYYYCYLRSLYEEGLRIPLLPL